MRGKRKKKKTKTKNRKQKNKRKKRGNRGGKDTTTNSRSWAPPVKGETPGHLLVTSWVPFGHI